MRAIERENDTLKGLQANVRIRHVILLAALIIYFDDQGRESISGLLLWQRLQIIKDVTDSSRIRAR